MSNLLTDSGSFRERTNCYLTASAQAGAPWFDDSGKWVSPLSPLYTRERFWLSFALYTAGKADLADAIILGSPSPEYHGIEYNVFDTNIATALIVEHGNVMSAETRSRLEKLTRDGFSFKPGNRQPDYQFHGYNDNMPAKATMGLVLGGELLNHGGALEYGLWNLRQLRAMLVRRGTNAEWNSPTYSPLTIHAIGAIAEHAANAEARELALGIEQRLWMDVAARFHPETGVVAGPYSRSYTADTVAHLSLMASLLWFVLGEAARPSPMTMFEEEKAAELVFHHAQDMPFNISQMCWLAAGHYHLPDQALELFAQKTYPFRAVASAESGDFTPDHPAAPVRIESYLTPDYTVATCDSKFLNGAQTMSYFVTYRRKSQVESIRDVSTVFTKMTIDGDAPGALDTHGPVTGEKDMLNSYANHINIQADSTVMVLTHPLLSLGGLSDGSNAAKPISGLRELVIFPSHHASADEVYVGGKRREGWSGSFGQGEWVACRRGRLLIGVRPLAFTGVTVQGLEPPRYELERVGEYETIRVSFYEGEPRAFTRRELAAICGGFVAEHASVDEYASLEAFAAALEQSRFTDYYWMTRRARYRRPAGSARPAVDIEAAWSAGATHPRFASINGQVVSTPVVEIDGIENDGLPFLNQPYQPVPPFFPWENFEVEWMPIPYGIGDRETP